MEENLDELIFNIMTEEYNDKIDKSKDLEEYLKSKTKNDLLSLYLIYGYASSEDFIIEEIQRLKNKKKEEIINTIINFLDKNILLILQFLNEKRIRETKSIAIKKELDIFSIEEECNISFDTIKILKQLNFIFCKKEQNKIIIHMPKFIKERIQDINENLYLDLYNEVILYSKGIVETYGVLPIQEAYNIIEKDIMIEFEKYNSIIKFVSLLELDTIYYSFEYQSLCNFNIHEDSIEDILNSCDELVIYNREMYDDMASDKYLMNLKEYKEFRKFLKEDYNFDINEDEFLRTEIINSYINIAQFDLEMAKEILVNALDSCFEINTIERDEIIEYINKIKRKMPIWKKGGRIDNVIKFQK